jgi:hypothetical protein
MLDELAVRRARFAESVHGVQAGRRRPAGPRQEAESHAGALAALSLAAEGLLTDGGRCRPDALAGPGYFSLPRARRDEPLDATLVKHAGAAPMEVRRIGAGRGPSGNQ